jgi:hypothetical protein
MIRAIPLEKGGNTMALSQSEKDETLQMVLLELEKMFGGITEHYNSEANHDRMLYLLDIEKAVKDRLMQVEQSTAA